MYRRVVWALASSDGMTGGRSHVRRALYRSNGPETATYSKCALAAKTRNRQRRTPRSLEGAVTLFEGQMRLGPC